MPTGIYNRKIKNHKERFVEKIEKKENGCWEWKAYRNKKGYGSFVALGETLAHRYSYIVYKGKIPKGFLVCHSCDNPPCVNPDHLWIGTNTDNQKDCMTKGRDRRNPVKGEQCGRSKLKEHQVIKIKQLRKTVKQPELAKMFNCHQTTIHCILSGKSWKHINA